MLRKYGTGEKTVVEPEDQAPRDQTIQRTAADGSWTSADEEGLKAETEE